MPEADPKKAKAPKPTTPYQHLRRDLKAMFGDPKTQKQAAVAERARTAESKANFVKYFPCAVEIEKDVFKVPDFPYHCVCPCVQHASPPHYPGYFSGSLQQQYESIQNGFNYSDRPPPLQVPQYRHNQHGFNGGNLPQEEQHLEPGMLSSQQYQQGIGYSNMPPQQQSQPAQYAFAGNAMPQPYGPVQVPSPKPSPQQQQQALENGNMASQQHFQPTQHGFNNGSMLQAYQPMQPSMQALGRSNMLPQQERQPIDHGLVTMNMSQQYDMPHSNQQPPPVLQPQQYSHLQRAQPLHLIHRQQMTPTPSPATRNAQIPEHVPQPLGRVRNLQRRSNLQQMTSAADLAITDSQTSETLHPVDSEQAMNVTAGPAMHNGEDSEPCHATQDQKPMNHAAGLSVAMHEGQDSKSVQSVQNQQLVIDDAGHAVHNSDSIDNQQPISYAAVLAMHTGLGSGPLQSVNNPQPMNYTSDFGRNSFHDFFDFDGAAAA